MPKIEECFVDLERVTIAASRLLEDVAEPMFHCMSLEGILAEIMKEEGCKSREAAAVSWMEDNFEALSSVIYAAGTLVEVLEP